MPVLTLTLTAPNGKRFTDVLSSEIEYTNVLGAIGYAQIKIDTPAVGAIRHFTENSTFLPANLYDWRARITYLGVTDFVGVVRRVEYGDNGRGGSYAILDVADLNVLLDSRVIAYRAGSAQADKTGAADDLIKAYVRENLGSLSTPDYDGNATTARDASAWLTVASDQAAAASVEWKASGAGLLETIQGLQKAAFAAGDDLLFGLRYTGDTAVLVTGVGFVGADRSGQAVFSQENGNLVNPKLIYDYTDYNTIAYAADAGKDAEQAIIETTNPNIALRTVASRREAWVNSSGETTDAVTADGQAEVMSAYPRIRFDAEIISNQRTPYNRPVSGGWRLGDIVKANFGGQSFNVLVKAVHVKTDPKTGDTQVRARIESTGVIY